MIYIPSHQDDHRLALETLIVVGTSTGGPQALTALLSELVVLPRTACLVVQHMPAGFTANLAKRLNQVSKWIVKEAEDRAVIQEGVLLVAPGGSQLRIARENNGFYASVKKDGPFNGHQPAVDVLFASVAETWQGKMIGVLMTGMGKDGAVGLKSIRERGGYTIAEAAETCIVYGMPKAAVNMNAAVTVQPLHEIAVEVEKGWRRLNSGV